ncbi:hypothetical protein Tco_0192434, partial [Tanacetum coccineum]
MKGDCSDVVGLVYGRDQGKHLNVDGFVDVDYAKDLDNDMSIIGSTNRAGSKPKVVVHCDNQ